jgi:hypothetical protein
MAKKTGLAVMIGIGKAKGPPPDSGMSAMRQMNSDMNPGDSGGGSATATVPVSALNVDGTAPQEGDTVNFSVEGTVKSISGKDAVVSINTIDGEDVEDYADQGADEGAEGDMSGGKENLSQMGARLRKKAAASSGGY